MSLIFTLKKVLLENRLRPHKQQQVEDKSDPKVPKERSGTQRQVRQIEINYFVKVYYETFSF
jgi:hypothetical protein